MRGRPCIDGHMVILAAALGFHAKEDVTAVAIATPIEVDAPGFPALPRKHAPCVGSAAAGHSTERCLPGS